MKRIHLIISGHVQGVGFRYFCQSQAERLGLFGYARNREDGSVQVEVEGDDEALEKFVMLAHSGPRMAHVTNVELEERTFRNDSDFKIA